MMIQGQLYVEKGDAQKVNKQLVALWLLVGLVCISTLSGCSGNDVTTNNNPTMHYDERKSVEQFGIIPEAFQKVIENNLFRDIIAFDGRLLTAEVLSVDEEKKSVTQKVRMMDLYGNDLAAYTYSSDDAYHISTLTATDDGGFLFVIGFSDYAYDQNTMASDKGFASHVIKCDREGNLQFDTSFDRIEGYALQYCFERNEQFYLFGEIQAPETKTRGVYSPTDIYMVVLDKNGNILNTQRIAGSDYDSLDAAEITDGAFLLSISSQSDDGDFAGSASNGYPVDWVITVNDSLEIIEKKLESGRDHFDDRIGEKDGAPLYKSDVLLNDFDAGTVDAFIDYSDFYLIVSVNITGEYEHTPPMISSIWYCMETVYSAYDYNGKMVFRASVDSSPNYDAWVESFDSAS